MSIIKTALVASVLSLAVVATASAQYDEKIYPNGDYLAIPTPSASQPLPAGRATIDGQYGETTLNGNYVPTGSPAPSAPLSPQKDQLTVNGQYGQTTLNGNYVPTTEK